MLNQLSKKDKQWREIACKICGGDKAMADDVVQEMYLRRLNNDRGQKTTDYYIICTMRSIFLNMKSKSKKSVSFSDIEYMNKIHWNDNDETTEYERTKKLYLSGADWILQEESVKFEPTDEQQELLHIASKLNYTKRELLELNYDNSLRDIQKQYGINYMYVYRAVQDARKEILGDDMHLYKNKRLKHMKSKAPNGGGS